MSDTTQPLSPEVPLPNAPVEEARPAPEAPQLASPEPDAQSELPPELASARVRGSLPVPASPLERAKLESQGLLPTQTKDDERSTMVAFGLLFIVPILIILLSLLLLFPFINAQVNREPDASGVDTQSISKGQTPTR